MFSACPEVGSVNSARERAMSWVQVEIYVRTGGGFRQVSEVTHYGDVCQYVQGAISLAIDRAELLGFELWDDVKWLWPFIVQAIEECRRNGTGRRGFPDQPISIEVARVWGDNLRVAVTDGDTILNTALSQRTNWSKPSPTPVWSSSQWWLVCARSPKSAARSVRFSSCG